jgi:hypothetical protein
MNDFEMLLASSNANLVQVYENIISDLRSQLDRTASSHSSVLAQLESLSKKASRVDQLEQEVSMYRDAVKVVAIENQR